jgi:hypothetical protein
MILKTPSKNYKGKWSTVRLMQKNLKHFFSILLNPIFLLSLDFLQFNGEALSVKRPSLTRKILTH